MWIHLVKFINPTNFIRQIVRTGGITGNGMEPLIDYDCAGNLNDLYGEWGFQIPA